MPRGKAAAGKQANGAVLGFEEKLWAAADKMRGHMDPSEYKHVTLGLIFLKYISDAFDERRNVLEHLTAEPSSEYFVREEKARYEEIEDRDEYVAENVFRVPAEARWSYLQARAQAAGNWQADRWSDTVGAARSEVQRSWRRCPGWHGDGWCSAWIGFRDPQVFEHGSQTIQLVVCVETAWIGQHPESRRPNRRLLETQLGAGGPEGSPVRAHAQKCDAMWLVRMSLSPHGLSTGSQLVLTQAVGRRCGSVHKARDTETEGWQQRLFKRLQHAMRESAPVERLPETVAWPREVMTNGC